MQAQRIRWLRHVKGISEKWMTKKNVEEEIFLQNKEGMITYKMAGQCGDRGHRLERKSRGQSRLEKVHQEL